MIRENFVYVFWYRFYEILIDHIRIKQMKIQLCRGKKRLKSKIQIVLKFIIEMQIFQVMSMSKNTHPYQYRNTIIYGF